MANLFDTTNYPTTEPSTIIAGDRLAFKRTDLDSDYPVATYSLKYSARLENGGSTEISFTASESGNDYIVEVAAATTAAYTVGIYHWQAYIIRTTDSERITIDSGTWEIKANRDIATTDPRSHIKKVLDAIESVIENRATLDQENYSIQGRSLGRTPIADLLLLRDKYRAEYVSAQRAERISNGLGHSGIIKVRF
jgi:hypothetical protein